MNILTIGSVSLRFGGLVAVEDVSFAVRRHEVFTLIGPNGAGKTTTLNLISGLYAASAGSIVFKGRELTGRPPHQIARSGIARTFQNLELFASATVLDNLLLGREIHRRHGWLEELAFTRRVAAQERAFREFADAVLDFLRLQRVRDVRVCELPYGTRKVVELGRALALGPELLLLDEPSSGLNDSETEVMSEWILEMRRRWNLTIVMVEHDMNLVSHVSDRVLAMVSGKVVALGTPDQVRNDAAVVKAYLGG
jgi:branched-chain amino acid transport system ATP-binding protein